MAKLCLRFILANSTRLFPFYVCKTSKYAAFSTSVLSQVSFQTKEVYKTPVSTYKKKRLRKKTYIGEGSVSRKGFWNVVAFATADEYDLDAMYNELKNNEVYQPSKLFELSYTPGSGFDFLHATAKINVDNEKREMFIFREGSMVAWNVTDLEIHNILKFVESFEISSYDDSVVYNEIEVMPYTYTINSKHSVLQNGNICLTQEETKTPLDKYTFSNAMTLSVKLGVWETLLDKYIESMEPLTVDLKMGKRLSVSRKQLLKKTGEFYALKHSINLTSDLLDVPDFYWERDELERLYLQTCRYFNIPRRTKVINEKLNHCIELMDLVSTHLSDKHHTRLELMIIGLITVEVVFELIHYAEMYLGSSN